MGLSDGFLDEHRGCGEREPTEAAEARYEYSTPEEWARSWDTGLSSMTIFKFMKNGHVDRPEVPHDVDDLGRCIRLLRVAPPTWRKCLQNLARAYPEWARLVANWDLLETLYERMEECVDNDGISRYATQIYNHIREFLR